MGFNEQFEEFGVGVVHHFGDDGSGVYIKETRIPKGVRLGMHEHTFTHKSALVSGSVVLRIPDKEQEIHSPAILTLCQNVPHEIEALSDAVWLCIHATEENDPDKIDHSLVSNE